MKIYHNTDYISLLFDYPVRILSSAFYNGGYGRRKAILNLKTTDNILKRSSPEELIKNKIEDLSLPKMTSAMLTSAELQFAQFFYIENQGIKVSVAVSAGASNALNISERSETTYNGNPLNKAGTINTIIMTNMWLLSDCLVSAVISATEAKGAALIDLNVKSSISKKQATGTGTDSITIVSGNADTIQFAGGHTLFGQLIGETVYNAVKSSLQKVKTDKSIIPTIQKEMEY